MYPKHHLVVGFGYDGTRFHGVPPQPDLPTVAAALKQRFTDAGLQPRRFCIAARTDRGVSARRNVATCWVPVAVDLAVAIPAICDPRDDGLTEVSVAVGKRSTHARGSNEGKHYRYTIEYRPDEILRPGLTEEQAWVVATPLDAGAMHRAAQALVGEHDFSAYRTVKCAANDPTRTIHRIDVTESRREDGRCFIHIDVVGASFLRKMMRIIAGSLALVGAGWWPESQIKTILTSLDRGEAGPTASAEGLCLIEVYGDYGELPRLVPSERPALNGALV